MGLDAKRGDFRQRISPFWCVDRSRHPYLMRCNQGRPPSGRGGSAGSVGASSAIASGTSPDGEAAFFVDFESHAGAVLARIDGRHLVDRHRQFAGDTAEAGLKFDQFVADLQLVGRVRPDVEDDLAVADELARHARPLIDLNGNVGREAVVAAPFVDGADQIGFGGRQFHALLAHRLFGRRQRVDEALAAEHPLGVLHQRRRCLRRARCRNGRDARAAARSPRRASRTRRRACTSAW